MVLLDELLLLAQPLEPLEPQIAIIEHAEHLSLPDDVSRPGERLGDVAVEGRDGGPLDASLHHRRRRKPIVPARGREDGHGDREAQNGELAADVPGADDLRQLSASGVGRLRDQPAVLAALELEHGAGKRRDGLAHLHRRRVERAIGRTFQGEPADDASAGRDGNGAHRARPALTGECRLRAGHCGPGAAGRRMDKSHLLIDRLVHGRGDRADEVGLLPELRAVGHGTDVDAAASHEPEADPIAIEARRERRHEGGCRRVEAVLLDRSRGQIEHGLEPLLDRHVLGCFITAEQDLEPREAPLELPLDGLELGLGAGGHVEDDDAVEVTGHLDGVRHVEAFSRAALGIRLTLDNEAVALNQCALGGRGQVLHVPAWARPHGRGRERTAVGRPEEEKSAGNAWDLPALQSEPASTERLERRRFGELRPQGALAISLQPTRAPVSRLEAGGIVLDVEVAALHPRWSRSGRVVESHPRR